MKSRKQSVTLRLARRSWILASHHSQACCALGAPTHGAGGRQCHAEEQEVLHGDNGATLKTTQGRTKRSPRRDMRRTREPERPTRHAGQGPRATACPSMPWPCFARARDFVQGVEHMRLLQDAGGSCVQGRCLQSRPMNFTDMLRAATAREAPLLCVGLAHEPARFPVGMQGDARKIYDFCAAVVDATADLVCAFKPQIAYFAAHGAEEQLERLMQHMRS